jgi:DNA-binding MarR family transcriptional regulator
MNDAPGFDLTIHAPDRLRICVALDEVEEAEFRTVRDALDVSDSVLSKHVTVLVDAGYLVQRRAVRDTRQRVWLSLTAAGRREIVGVDLSSPA